MLEKKKEIRKRIAELDSQLSAQRDGVLSLASSVLDRDVSLSSLHGIIGSKNRDFGDIEKRQFTSVNEFQSVWAENMLAHYEPYKKYWKSEKDLPSILKLYKNDTIRQYILLFQERNYYRWYEQRIREKPSKPLWELWFGSEIVFGLYVALTFYEDGSFKFKSNEVRKVPYHYWTIGNILGVKGFVNGETGKLYAINTIDDLLNFYEHIIYCSSSSIYEKAIYTKYIEYLRSSPNASEEPFLIPELHYEGKGQKCTYRLDFTICNSYTFETVGFELSPASTHVTIKKAKEKTQQQLNEELSKDWEKECSKRNSYFSKYGITIITFTDTDLKDIDACFDKIKFYLQKRRHVPQSIDDTVHKIETLITE